MRHLPYNGVIALEGSGCSRTLATTANATLIHEGIQLAEYIYQMILRARRTETKYL